MLPKRRRITRQNFPANPRGGAVMHSPHFSLRMTPAGATPYRVSVVVSKKVAARSVDRHLVKRRVYESVARSEEISPGVYVFFAKKDAHTISFRELHGEITKLLSDARSAIVKPSQLV